MSRFQRILSLVGEEKPGLICSALKRIFRLPEPLSIIPVPGDATSYNLQYEDKIIPYQICDSRGSSPDLIVKYEEGPNDFIEITKGSFKDSGNNIQFQRFTKFVPVSNSEQRKIYSLTIEDTNINSDKNKLAMKCWKKNGIELIATNEDLQTVFDNLDTNFTLEEFAEEWTQVSRESSKGIFKGTKQTITIEEDLIKVENFNVLKNGKITHDPGIGTIMLVLSTILQFNSGKPILITRHHLTQELIDDADNKFLKGICTLKQKFDTEIRIEGIILPNLNIEYSSLNCESKSEKIVSIHEEVQLIEQGHTIFFTNHARGELEKFTINGYGKTIEKDILKADIIYADTENETIYMVEAERHCNYETGVRQIESWRSEETRNFYRNITNGTQYEGYQFKAYLILYDSSNTHSECRRYVKKILNKSRETFENVNHETLLLF